MQTSQKIHHITKYCLKKTINEIYDCEILMKSISNITQKAMN